jgi:hypothetical protein
MKTNPLFSYFCPLLSTYRHGLAWYRKGLVFGLGYLYCLISPFMAQAQRRLPGGKNIEWLVAVPAGGGQASRGLALSLAFSKQINRNLLYKGTFQWAAQGYNYLPDSLYRSRQPGLSGADSMGISFRHTEIGASGMLAYTFFKDPSRSLFLSVCGGGILLNRQYAGKTLTGVASPGTPASGATDFRLPAPFPERWTLGVLLGLETELYLGSKDNKALLAYFHRRMLASTPVNDRTWQAGIGVKFRLKN